MAEGGRGESVRETGERSPGRMVQTEVVGYEMQEGCWKQEGCGMEEGCWKRLRRRSIFAASIDTAPHAHLLLGTSGPGPRRVLST